MSSEEEWSCVATDVIYGLDILVSHFINNLEKEDLEVIWKTQDLMKKLMNQNTSNHSETGTK